MGYNKLAILLSAVVFSGAAMATGGGNIQFTGQVDTTACSVTGDDHEMVTVNLKPVSSAIFTAVGAKGDVYQDFTIHLENCDTTVQKTATVTFKPTTASVDGLSFPNETVGGASGVGIQIYESDGTTAITQGLESVAQRLTDGAPGALSTSDLKFVAGYVQDSATTVSGGAVTSTGTFTVEYY